MCQNPSAAPLGRNVLFWSLWGQFIASLVGLLHHLKMVQEGEEGVAKGALPFAIVT